MKFTDPGFEASSTVQAGFLWDCSTQSSAAAPIFFITNKAICSLLGSCPLLVLAQTKVPHKVVTIHNLHSHRRGHPLWLLLLVYQLADAVIVHTEQQKKGMMRAGRILEDKIHVVILGGQQVNLRGLVRTRVTFLGALKNSKVSLPFSKHFESCVMKESRST
jgi:hypothetical protein